MSAYPDRMPVILDWRKAGAWLGGDNPADLLRPAPEEALQEWIVSTRVNKAGVGHGAQSLVERVLVA